MDRDVKNQEPQQNVNFNGLSTGFGLYKEVNDCDQNQFIPVKSVSLLSISEIRKCYCNNKILTLENQCFGQQEIDTILIAQFQKVAYFKDLHDGNFVLKVIVNEVSHNGCLGLYYDIFFTHRSLDGFKRILDKYEKQKKKIWFIIKNANIQKSQLQPNIRKLMNDSIYVNNEWSTRLVDVSITDSFKNFLTIYIEDLLFQKLVQYTPIVEIEGSNRVNIFAVITKILKLEGITKNNTKHTMFILQDMDIIPNKKYELLLHIFFNTAEDEFCIIPRVGNILRIKSAYLELFEYTQSIHAKVFSSRALVQYDSSVDNFIVPYTTCSSYIFTEQDKKTVLNLQHWWNENKLNIENTSGTRIQSLESSHVGHNTVGELKESRSCTINKRGIDDDEYNLITHRKFTQTNIEVDRPCVHTQMHSLSFETEHVGDFTFRKSLKRKSSTTIKTAKNLVERKKNIQVERVKNVDEKAIDIMKYVDFVLEPYMEEHLTLAGGSSEFMTSHCNIENGRQSPVQICRAKKKGMYLKNLVNVERRVRNSQKEPMKLPSTKDQSYLDKCSTKNEDTNSQQKLQIALDTDGQISNIFIDYNKDGQEEIYKGIYEISLTVEDELKNEDCRVRDLFKSFDSEISLLTKHVIIRGSLDQPSTSLDIKFPLCKADVILFPNVNSSSSVFQNEINKENSSFPIQVKHGRAKEKLYSSLLKLYKKTFKNKLKNELRSQPDLDDPCKGKFISLPSGSDNGIDNISIPDFLSHIDCDTIENLIISTSISANEFHNISVASSLRNSPQFDHDPEEIVIGPSISYENYYDLKINYSGVTDLNMSNKESNSMEFVNDSKSLNIDKTIPSDSERVITGKIKSVAVKDLNEDFCRSIHSWVVGLCTNCNLMITSFELKKKFSKFDLWKEKSLPCTCSINDHSQNSSRSPVSESKKLPPSKKVKMLQKKKSKSCRLEKKGTIHPYFHLEFFVICGELEESLLVLLTGEDASYFFDFNPSFQFFVKKSQIFEKKARMVQELIERQIPVRMRIKPYDTSMEEMVYRIVKTRLVDLTDEFKISNTVDLNGFKIPAKVKIAEFHNKTH